jgi:hypothetical protein
MHTVTLTRGTRFWFEDALRYARQIAEQAAGGDDPSLALKAGYVLRDLGHVAADLGVELGEPTKEAIEERWEVTPLGRAALCGQAAAAD